MKMVIVHTYVKLPEGNHFSYHPAMPSRTVTGDNLSDPKKTWMIPIDNWSLRPLRPLHPLRPGLFQWQSPKQLVFDHLSNHFEG